MYYNVWDEILNINTTQTCIKNNRTALKINRNDTLLSQYPSRNIKSTANHVLALACTFIRALVRKSKLNIYIDASRCSASSGFKYRSTSLLLSYIQDVSLNNGATLKNCSVIKLVQFIIEITKRLIINVSNPKFVQNLLEYLQSSKDFIAKLTF